MLLAATSYCTVVLYRMLLYYNNISGRGNASHSQAQGGGWVALSVLERMRVTPRTRTA